MNTVDWTQLDESNKRHYQRRPRWVVEAESKQQQAEAAHEVAVDNWLDNGGMTWEQVEHAGRLALACYEYAQDCRKSWHAGLSAPEHDENYYQIKHGLLEPDGFSK